MFFGFILITTITGMTEKSLPHGLAANFAALFSGQLEEAVIDKAMANLPAAHEELSQKWNSINVTRASGLVPTFEGGPFDDCVRDMVWLPSLQNPMPTALGLPESRGLIQKWRHGEVNEVKDIFRNSLKNKKTLGK